MKTPCLDGMTSGFYQKHWGMVGTDVCNGVQHLLISGQMLRKINYTHVTLIPKVKDATMMTQLRSISLCNVIYKILANVLTNKLNIILPRIISPTQSAFIPGRLISDNYLVAAEVAHYMYKRSSGPNGLMALKLDISKAYDQVEWSFLEALMYRMGFSERWIRLVMLCVTTVSYSFKVNGNPVGYVHPKRGICQGDPLSPYFFVICVEGLSVLLRKVEFNGELQGIKVCHEAPSIHHLFLTDDSFYLLVVLLVSADRL